MVMIDRPDTTILSWLKSKGVFVALATVFVVMALAAPQFATVENLRNLLQQNAVIGVIACGMTFAHIIGGFDLSVGSTAAMASIVMAVVYNATGSIPLGLVAALLAGVLAGLVSGRLIAVLRINPFVATLGTKTIIRGLVFVAQTQLRSLVCPLASPSWDLAGRWVCQTSSSSSS